MKSMLPKRHRPCPEYPEAEAIGQRGEKSERDGDSEKPLVVVTHSVNSCFIGLLGGKKSAPTLFNSEKFGLVLLGEDQSIILKSYHAPAALQHE
jgi:hypothetical protein